MTRLVSARISTTFLAILLALVPATGAATASTEPAPFEVRAGETVTLSVPGTLRASSVTIDGSLVAIGDLVIEATGRVSVTGSIRVERTGLALPGQTAPTGSVFVSAPDIVVAEHALIAAADGAHASPVDVTSLDPRIPAVAVGAAGEDGGNVVLRATGSVKLEGDLVPGLGGDGGDAKAVAAAGDAAHVDGGSAKAWGGRGGAGGVARVETPDGVRIVATQPGGHGGSASATGGDGAGGEGVGCGGTDGASSIDPPLGAPAPGQNAEADAQNGVAGCAGTNGSPGASPGGSGGDGQNGQAGGNGGDAEAYGGDAQASTICFSRNGGSAIATAGRGGDGGTGGQGGHGAHGKSSAVVDLELQGTHGGHGGDGGDGGGFSGGTKMYGGDAIAVGGDGACIDGNGGSAIARAGNGGRGGVGGHGGDGGDAGCDAPIVGDILFPGPNQGGSAGLGGAPGHPGGPGIASATAGTAGGSWGEDGEADAHNGSWGAFVPGGGNGSSGDDC